MLVFGLSCASEQDTVSRTRDFISCIGGGFDAAAWNELHGTNCTHPYKCAPIPEDRPHNVDCGWIQSRLTTFGGTGYADGVGASEGEQYLSAIYFAMVTLTTVGYGDILPNTTGEKQFVMTCIVFGAFLYAYLLRRILVV